MQPLFLILLIILSFKTYGQEPPSHRLTTSIEIHNGGRVFDFVVDSIYTDAAGQEIYLYKEEIFQNFKIIGSLQLPPKNNLPKVKKLELNSVGTKGIRLRADWDLNQKNWNAPIFFRKMNSPIRMKLTILPTALDLSPKQIVAETMTIELKVYPHLFYSNRNNKSPFKRSAPYLKLSLAYLEGHTWHVKVGKNMVIRQKLSPLRK